MRTAYHVLGIVALSRIYEHDVRPFDTIVDSKCELPELQARASDAMLNPPFVQRNRTERLLTRCSTTIGMSLSRVSGQPALHP